MTIISGDDDHFTTPLISRQSAVAYQVGAPSLMPSTNQLPPSANPTTTMGEGGSLLNKSPFGT